mgnify:CR=1 FL=1
MFAIDNYDFTGKRAIIRVDFNVPLNGEGQVTDDTRIRAAIPTIKKVLEKGGSVILMSHLGRPKKNPDPKFSLEQIIPAIEARLGVKVEFAGDCMGEKAAGAGFDWEKKEDVWDKVREEVAEVETEMKAGNQANLEAEFGDLFFALINACRLYGVDPESALERTNKKFLRRFTTIEETAEKRGKSLRELSLDEMETIWQEAKKSE